MSSLRLLFGAVSLSALCVSSAFAQSTPDATAPHGWHMPNKEEMAAWHSQKCKDRYARAAGRLAYLEAALSLTDAQRGAYDNWRDAILSSAKARSDACLARTPDQADEHDVLARTARMQKMLEAKLDELRSQRPALEALYQSLTPDQRKLLDRAADHLARHRIHRMDERFGERHNGEMHEAPG
jgi:hypothetical protein